ncbi:hypothetical protein [Actinophytocola oryzae]|uniref:hypothetical protein n=1 Tax=Actinophytocola oryzae TaxID=502181 RepID=UPI001062C6B2|nr:hypothetical protein [Actinophytocola oryzae]
MVDLARRRLTATGIRAGFLETGGASSSSSRRMSSIFADALRSARRTTRTSVTATALATSGQIAAAGEPCQVASAATRQRPSTTDQATLEIVCVEYRPAGLVTVLMRIPLPSIRVLERDTREGVDLFSTSRTVDRSPGFSILLLVHQATRFGLSVTDHW